MKNIAVILSGSGVYDGSEIHEATFTMYGISKFGLNYQVFAPNIEQYHVINHLTGDIMDEKRNVLIESARIARGNIKDLKDFNPTNYDAVIFPGGFGVAKNLCTFAIDGINCSVNNEIEKIIINMHKAKKPIGALCISPVLIAKVINNCTVSIGNDKETEKAILNLGATHQTTKHGEVMIDKENNIYTTPCYMLDSTIAQIADGAINLVETIIRNL